MTHPDIKLSNTARNIAPNGDYLWLCGSCSHAASGWTAMDAFGEDEWPSATVLNVRVFDSMLIVRGMELVALNETTDSNLLTACDLCAIAHESGDYREGYTVRYVANDFYDEATIDEARAHALIRNDSTARYTVQPSESIPTIDTITRVSDGEIVALIANSGIRPFYRTVFDARYGVAIVSVAREDDSELTNAKILLRFVAAGY